MPPDRRQNSARLAPLAIGPGRLAIVLWGTFLLTWQIFTISIGAHPFLLIFPFIWVAHGLLLTAVLHGFVGRANELQGWLKWAALTAIVLVLTVAQTYLDTQLSMRLAGWLVKIFEWDIRGGALLFYDGVQTREMGVQFTTMSYFWVFGCYTLADSLLRSQRRLSAARLEAQQAELSALRLRINPHFLFNALGGVSTLIRSGKSGEADRALLKLIDFYRNTLIQDASRMTTLEEEMDMIEAYLEIERIRFPARLRVTTDIAQGLGLVSLPGFILQPLVENAVKHGVGASSDPVDISISANALAGSRIRLEVRENSRLSDVQNPMTGTGTGLRNIRDRLKSLYGEEADLWSGRAGDGFSSIVELPIVEPAQVEA